VNQGGDVEIDYLARIYGANALAAFWPWGGGALGTLSTPAVPIGSLGTTVGKSFVMNVVPNTPAANNPNTITAALTILSPDVDLQLLFSSIARDVPIRLSCLATQDIAGTTTSKIILS
jgi:hypothetical protein